MNVLFLATYGDFLATFELSNIRLWIELGCTVHCASNFKEEKYNLKTNRLDELGVIRHELEFTRNPFNTSNIKTYKQLKQIIKEEKIDIIDCHNAIVGAYARIAASKCKINKVIYTPHSFFFYEGCPKKNKIIFKNVESLLAKKTDILVTINQEDYNAALKMKTRGKTIFVPGVGIDTKAIEALPSKRNEYRKEFGIPESSVIFLSVGELITRKNHEIAIRAFAEMNMDNAYYLICGIGELEDYLSELIKELGMESKIKLLGYRLDVKEIMKASDVYLFPSFQEGLPVALMEAMSAGLPCIVSRIRGNVDLIEDDNGGLFFMPNDKDSLVNAISIFNEIDKNTISKWEDRNVIKAREYDINNVQSIMRKEYSNLLVK